MMQPFFRLLTQLSSRKTISKWVGSFSKSRWSKHLIPKFAKIYGIALDEAEKSIEEYESLNEFFTRKLKSGTRPIDSSPSALVSPVDALITGMGEIEDGLLINVKGQDYNLKQLLNHSPRAVSYKNGYYFVLYLSPTDYHRIHAPTAGAIVEKEHVPGKVYPVNDFGLRQMKHVLSRNERVITYIQHADGEVAVVKVGAMNVSSIQYVNPLLDQIERGAELAYFEFGSTVVLLTENGTFTSSDQLNIGSRVRVGQSLGRLKHK